MLRNPNAPVSIAPVGKRKMQTNAAKAKRYRERAEEIRKISADVRGDASRKYLLGVAADYERMARAADRAPRG